MKKTLLACSVLAVLSGGAFAADMPAPPPAYAPVYKAPPPAPTFSGCYIDGGVGYGVSNIDHNGETIPGLVPTSSSTTSGGRGWLGRAGGGCDYQFTLLNTWPAVIGLLADYDFSNVSGTVTDPLGMRSGNCGSKRRVWYAGAPGWPAANAQSPDLRQRRLHRSSFQSNGLIVPDGAGDSVTQLSLSAHTFNGWFIGGGTEYAFTWLPINGLFWRTEYRYTQYQGADVPSFVTATGAPTGLGQHVTPQVQTVTTSLVWRFNWGNW